MNKKTVAFEVDSGDEIEIKVEWSYSYQPAKLDGPPEYCYPEEEDSELVLPADLDKIITDYFVKNVLPDWKKTIENRCLVIECDGDLAEWAKELKDRE
jgi:hypothetical protein